MCVPRETLPPIPAFLKASRSPAARRERLPLETVSPLRQTDNVGQKFSRIAAIAAMLPLVAFLETPADACPPVDFSGVESITPRGFTNWADHLEVRLSPGADPGSIRIRSPLGPPRRVTPRREGGSVATAVLSTRERRALESGRVVPFTVEVHGARGAVDAERFVVGGRQSRGGLGPDRLLFVFLGLSLFGVGWLYRREPETEHRLRLAGAGGLIAVLFLCTAPAMPWTESAELGYSTLRNQCMLGHEAACLTQGGLDLDAAAEPPAQLVERAHWTSAAIRAGHASIILMLLPACIWLMVAPRSRGAQGLVIAGAAPALFTGIATALYAWILGDWRTGAGGAADLTLLACASLLAVATVAGLLGRKLRAGEPIPTAVAREEIV